MTTFLLYSLQRTRTATFYVKVAQHCWQRGRMDSGCNVYGQCYTDDRSINYYHDRLRLSSAAGSIQISIVEVVSSSCDPCGYMCELRTYIVLMTERSRATKTSVSHRLNPGQQRPSGSRDLSSSTSVRAFSIGGQTGKTLSSWRLAISRQTQ